jgi:ribosomal protein L6P/L9E
VNGQSSLILGFYRMLDLVGLGFRITKITDSIFLFDMGFSCGIYFVVPSNVRVFYSPSLKKLIVFSHDLRVVSDVVSSLLLLRGPHVYKVRGFIDTKTIVRLRTGKQR